MKKIIAEHLWKFSRPSIVSPFLYVWINFQEKKSNSFYKTLKHLYAEISWIKNLYFSFLYTCLVCMSLNLSPFHPSSRFLLSFLEYLFKNIDTNECHKGERRKMRSESWNIATGICVISVYILNIYERSHFHSSPHPYLHYFSSLFWNFHLETASLVSQRYYQSILHTYCKAELSCEMWFK